MPIYQPFPVFAYRVCQPYRRARSGRSLDAAGNVRVLAGAEMMVYMPPLKIKNMITRANLKRRIVRTEHDEQKEFFKMVRWSGITGIFAIPNGGMRNKIVAVKLKAEGVEPGIPDIFCAKARKGYHGLFIEMKRTDGGKGLSDNQKQWFRTLTAEGYLCRQANGAASAWEILTDYLGA